jgi:hypothetical protein
VNPIKIIKNKVSAKLRSLVANEVAKELAIFRQSVGQSLLPLTRDTTIMEQIRANWATTLALATEMNAAQDYPDKTRLLEASLVASPQFKDGLFLEFGVWKGDSIRKIASFARTNVFGFDSFEGLPEGWRPGYPAGAFALNALPDVPENVELVKGWFNETLPRFLEANTGPISFIHMDCDLYSSTKTVLDLCNPRILSGTVILFDELVNHPRWESGEYKALHEWAQQTARQFDYIGYCPTDEQVAIKIK